MKSKCCNADAELTKVSETSIRYEYKCKKCGMHPCNVYLIADKPKESFGFEIKF